MTQEITDTTEIADLEYDGYGEPTEPRTDMVATEEATGRGIEFHVSMRDYTLRDMETLIVEAAARQVLGGRDNREIAKTIEAACIAQVTAKADQALSKVAAEIIDAPMVPSFATKEPVTMREFLGLYGREYLTQRVNSSGATSDSHYDRTTRMEWLVRKHMDAAFNKEIQAATSAAIREVTAALKAHHEAVLAEELKRFREALAKASGGGK